MFYFPKTYRLKTKRCPECDQRVSRYCQMCPTCGYRFRDILFRDPKRIMQFYELLSVGHSIGYVGKQMGVSRQRVHKLIDLLGWRKGWEKARAKYIARKRVEKEIGHRSRKCAQCSREFWYAKDAKHVLFCSEECRKEYRRVYMNVLKRRIYWEKKSKQT